MDKKTFLLLYPFQLFDLKKENIDVDNIDIICLVEEPLLFYDKIERPFHIHKLRIAFMRASMKHYADYLTNTFHSIRTQYVEYDDVPTFYKTIKGKHVNIFDLHDRTLYNKLNRTGAKLHITNKDPSFILDKEDMMSLVKAHAFKENLQQKTVFNHVKAKVNVLVQQKSLDHENRDSLPSNHVAQVRQSYFKPKIAKYYDEAERYVLNHKQFKKHHGNINNLRNLPITHQDAKKHFDIFLKQRFEQFGPYEDAIHTSDPIIFHSNCSFLINCGLLTPRQVLETVVAYKMKHPRLPMNSFEGFIRQLLGWREYMRYIYDTHYDDVASIMTKSSTSYAERLSDAWYKGTTGIDPIDTEINKLHTEGWCHHIVRLMVFLNFMKLAEFKPYAIYRWFMEMVALDAYEWVMWSNIVAMGMYNTRFMAKPYMSGSSYVLKMSTYKKGPWCKVWDAYFYRYLYKNKSKLKGKYALYLRNLAYFEKLSADEQNNILRKSSSNRLGL